MGACAITGASGYVGSVISAALREHLPVLGLSRKPRNSEDVAWSFESPAGVSDALRSRGVKTLIHAAWDMQATTFQELNRTCVDGSARLFDAAHTAGVERIVFISTISAFEGCRSAYGRTKLAVERMLKTSAGIIFRPGLVFGATSGGVFGTIRKQVAKGGLVPMIGDGRIPQYLLHESTLADCMRSAANGKFDEAGVEPITVAHPNPWPFRDLVQSIARSECRDVKLLPVPWQLLFAGIRTGELMKVKLPFRSDSILSFVYSNQDPDFNRMKSLGITPIPYTPEVTP